MITRMLVVCTFAAFTFATAALAQVPLGTGFVYQGQLDENGQPFTGAANLSFSLFNVDAGGAALGTQMVNAVPVNDGLFTVLLNAAGQFGATAFNGEKRWLEISVNGTPLAPRQELTAAPYARSAANLILPFTTSVNAATDAVNITQTGSGDGLQVSIINPANVGEAVEARSDGSGDAVQSVMTGTGRAGYFQVANAANVNEAIFATTNSTGTGMAVYGSATGDTGFNYGLYGSADSPNGHAVHGIAAAGSGGYFQSNGTNGTGVYGFAAATSGTTEAVYGQANSTSGRAVRGYATASTGSTVAGSFQALSTSGRGVSAEASAASGSTYGGHFTAISPSGVGAYGRNFDSMNEGFLGTANSGVHGEQHSGALTRGGVYGFSDLENGNGVIGEATMGSIPYSIWGRAAGLGYAGFFSDRVHVSGTLSKSGGAFKIDHPMDPANKYLWHSFVESPDMMNVYNGNVVTDGEGFAEITMPTWFETVNKDFRYQLTVIGQFAQAIVSQEIQDNKFVIQSDKPNVKVSWQVTGIRQDPWAESHRIPVEENKPEFERGYFLHPELYGAPKEKRIENAKAALNQ